MNFNIFKEFLLSLTYAVLSIDCPNVINLALGMNLDVQQPAIMTAIRSDCCGPASITCISSRVTSIDWDSLNLDGNINGTALPSSLITLSLQTNFLQGSIPNLPSGLQNLYLKHNKLTGPLPNFPNGMLYVSVHTNQLSGDVPILPISLQVLYLGYTGNVGNRFTGTVSINQPRTLFINSNYITNVLVQNVSQLVNCQLNDNPLLGNPAISTLSMCTKTGIYSPDLLPYTVSTSLKSSTFVLTNSRSSSYYAPNLSTFVLTNSRSSSYYAPNPSSAFLISGLNGPPSRSHSEGFKTMFEIEYRTINSVIKTQLSVPFNPISGGRSHSEGFKTIFELEYRTINSLTQTQSTVPFNPIGRVLSAGEIIKMVFRCLINFSVTSYVIKHAPFLRGIKNINSKQVRVGYDSYL